MELQIITILNALVHDWCDDAENLYDAVVEDVLDCLLTLVTTSEDVREECSNDRWAFINCQVEFMKSGVVLYIDRF